MRFKEIETKYDASKIDVSQFNNLMKKFKDEERQRLLVSSYDDYFVNSTGDAIRYRWTPDRGELTIKRKTTERHNNERIEINIPTKGDNLEAVSEFVKLLGYEYNFGIYKTCEIYWIDKVVMVYYVVYDKNFKELRRFIEIEADEDLEWDSEEQAWAEVIKYEKFMEPLGITAQHRLRKSLFETFQVTTS